MRLVRSLVKTIGVLSRSDRSRAPGGDGVEELPELAAPGWMWRGDELTRIGFWAMARRLPTLVGQAMGWAWQANRVDTSLAVGLTAAAGVLTGFGLLATQDVLAALFAAGPTVDRVEAAAPALVVVAAAVAARAGLSIAAGWAQARLEPQVNRVVERRLFEVTTLVELAAFDDAGFADEMDRARDRGGVAVKLLVEHAINLVTGLVGVLAVAGTLLVLHPLLLPLLLVAAVPGGWAAVRAARVEYVSLYRRITRQRRIWLLAALMANRHAAAEVRAYGMRGFLLGEYDRMMAAESRASLTVANQQAATRAVGGTLAGVATAGVYAVLGVLLIAEAVPLAAAGTAVLALQAGKASLEVLIRNINGVYEEGLYVGDLDTFFTRAAAHTPPARPIARVGAPREIAVEAVGLRYPESDTWALREVSLSIEHGQTVALVGENGSGKTTLAKLLAGLYQPTEGRIAWDGVDLADIDGDAARDHIALIHQDWWRLPFTAGRNIALGRWQRDGGDPSITNAAQAADAHQMIIDLPRGYDTLLDRTFKGGHDLSGGQWQRLVAARGFYRDAPILICDEPSASLDARAEHHLFQQVRRRAGAATTVLITHRLANVRHADHIYVLHHGQLIEQGSHDHLIAAEGRYAELFTMQAAGYLADPDTDLIGEPP